MWLRNLLFLGLLLGGAIALGALLFPPPAPQRVSHFDPSEYTQPDFRAVVEQVDAAVRQPWPALQVQPAPLVDDLTVARRLSFALTGTIPSVQEIRQLEAQTEDQRLAWWLAGIFQDQRYADYLAERLARVCVGTENGPFIVYRRRRLVLWLSEQLQKNRPYDQLVRDIIASEGLWTNRPALTFGT